MNRASVGLVLLTAAVTLLGCSDPAGPEVVGEFEFAELTSPGGTHMGDGDIFPDTEPIDFPGIVLEQEGNTIEVRGAGSTPHGVPLGVVELEGDQLTVSITHTDGAADMGVYFAFRATTSDLESGSYDVRVVFDELGGYPEPTVVFSGTAEIN